MSILASKTPKSEYALFLEWEINNDRKIKLYETDNEDDLLEKWKQEPLSYKSQQKIWDFFPNTELANVIELVHSFDKRMEINSISDIYRLNAQPQMASRKREDVLYTKTTNEEIYYLRLKILSLEKQLRELKAEEKNNDEITE